MKEYYEATDKEHCVRVKLRGGVTNHQWLLPRQRACRSHCSGQRFVSRLEGASFW